MSARLPARTEVSASSELTLLDLLDRLLQGGVVVQGDITLAVADIDLVRLDLRLVLAAVDSLRRLPPGAGAGALGGAA